jgi:hypothetical protein
MGFLISNEQAQDWLKADSQNQKVLKLFSMGANLAQNPHGKPDRWIIDFDEMEIEEVSEYKLPFQHVKSTVKPEREKNRVQTLRDRWWNFKRTNQPMRAALASLENCFAVPRVSKWAIPIVIPVSWLAGEKSVTFASDDFYVLGILLSTVHRTWMEAQKSTLKGDIAYTPTTCFETFPFPQNLSTKISTTIRATAQDLHDYRSQQMEKKQWGITKLYNDYFNEPASQLAKLHAKLDALVLQAYGFKANEDLLKKLLELNQELAEKEKRGEVIVGPWSPC